MKIRTLSRLATIVGAMCVLGITPSIASASTCGNQPTVTYKSSRGVKSTSFRTLGCIVQTPTTVYASVNTYTRGTAGVTIFHEMIIKDMTNGKTVALCTVPQSWGEGYVAKDRIVSNRGGTLPRIRGHRYSIAVKAHIDIKNDGAGAKSPGWSWVGWTA